MASESLSASDWMGRRVLWDARAGSLFLLGSICFVGRRGLTSVLVRAGLAYGLVRPGPAFGSRAAGTCFWVSCGRDGRAPPMQGLLSEKAPELLEEFAEGGVVSAGFGGYSGECR